MDVTETVTSVSRRQDYEPTLTETRLPTFDTETGLPYTTVLVQVTESHESISPTFFDSRRLPSSQPWEKSSKGCEKQNHHFFLPTKWKSENGCSLTPWSHSRPCHR